MLTWQAPGSCSCTTDQQAWEATTWPPLAQTASASRDQAAQKKLFANVAEKDTWQAPGSCSCTTDQEASEATTWPPLAQVARSSASATASPPNTILRWQLLCAGLMSWLQAACRQVSSGRLTDESLYHASLLRVTI